MPIHLKRVYEPAAAGDGLRVLVDRLWPRGLSKAVARVDLWEKEIAPSTALRQWFDHDPARWAEFRERYTDELRANPAVAAFAARIGTHRATLLYGAKSTDCNHAIVIKEFLEKP
jgi:uncharacterized protein YeaO (DUF488 family)